MKRRERDRMKRARTVGQTTGTTKTPRSMHYRIGMALGIVLLPLIIVLLGMLPFFSPFFAFFLLLLFLIRPTEEVKRARVQIILWTIFVLPLLIIGFGAPFRGLTVIMGVFTRGFASMQSAELGQLLSPMPADEIIGVLGATVAAVCGSFALTTLRTQKNQLANIPTATVRSVAVGLAEFKGVARIAKGPAEKIRVDAFHPGQPGIPEGIAKERILQTEERWTGNAIGHRKMWRTFYLDDGTGRILVDPIGVEFWKGEGSPYFEPLRKIHLGKRIERTYLNPLPEETRWIEDGDPVYVIGSVEERPDVLSDAVDADRHVVRPSSEMRRPGMLERFLVPSFIGKKLVPGRQYYHVFFLSDSEENDLSAVTARAERQVLLWTLVWLGLSVWLAVGAFAQ